MDTLGAPWPGAVALSGGGDSLARMHLLAEWAKAHGVPPPVALIVDHALRKSSAAEARKAAGFARKAGLAAHILTRKGPVPKSGIEAMARDARYGLMGAWLRKHGIATLYVGHTLDDQAETFLLRLGRGSGLDGLSAMRALAPFPVSEFEDLNLARPMLGISRAALRAYLKTLNQSWLDDPMNSEARFARSRIRHLMPALEAAGLAPSRIADAANHLARARAALELATEAVLARAARPDGTRILLGKPADGGRQASLSSPFRGVGASFRQHCFGRAGQGCDPAWLPAVSGTPRRAGLWTGNPYSGKGKFQNGRKAPLTGSIDPDCERGVKLLTFCWLAIR